MSDETTTIETITDEQIDELQTEAGAAGDEELVWLCAVALDHGAPDQRSARRSCVEAIREAEVEVESIVPHGALDHRGMP